MTPRFLNMTLRTSPHLSQGGDVPWIMGQVVLALLPLVVLSVYLFGLSALLLVAVSTSKERLQASWRSGASRT